MQPEAKAWFVGEMVSFSLRVVRVPDFHHLDCGELVRTPVGRLSFPIS